MRKVHLLLFSAAIILVVSCSTFLSPQNNAGVSTADEEPATGKALYRHDPVTSEEAQNMMRFYVNNARKADHQYTKFNRQELIEILESMPDIDTVKFVMGAFTENGPGMKKGKPVILLQAIEQGREQPGGLALTFVYYKGAVCPPPDGSCRLE
jgi:hypothetical protein